MRHSPDNVCRGFKFGGLGRHCFFWISCRQFACRRATLAGCAEPHASCSICCFNRQQSVPDFNKLRKQELINNF